MGVNGYWLRVNGYWLRVNGYWLLVKGYGLLVTGYWLKVTGYWLRVTGYWLRVTGYGLLDFAIMPLHYSLAEDKRVTEYYSLRLKNQFSLIEALIVRRR